MLWDRRWRSRIGGCALVVLTLATAHQHDARAVGTFNIVVHPGPTFVSNEPALAALNRAADAWKAYIADPIVVHINVDFGTTESGILAGAFSATIGPRLSDVRMALIGDAANEADDGIVALLPENPTFNLPPGFAVDGFSRITRANAKALGLSASNMTDDAQITFSNTFAFDFDRSNGVAFGQYDFESLATHEIGHVLGFTSGVDLVDSVASARNVKPSTLDWFRFDNNGPNDPTTPADFQSFSRSMIPGNDAIFDQITLGFGGSVEVRMSTGLNKGDGRNASHWKDQLGLGIMDPTLAAGEISLLNENDLRALDLIGYEISVVPEARSLTLLFIGAFLARTWRIRPLVPRPSLFVVRHPRNA